MIFPSTTGPWDTTFGVLLSHADSHGSIAWEEAGGLRDYSRPADKVPSLGMLVLRLNATQLQLQKYQELQLLVLALNPAEGYGTCALPRTA
jgi:hypothetical protein